MMAVRQISALPATTSSAQFSYGLRRLLPVQTVGKLRARRFPTGDCEGEGDRGGEGCVVASDVISFTARSNRLRIIPVERLV